MYLVPLSTRSMSSKAVILSFRGRTAGGHERLSLSLSTGVSGLPATAGLELVSISPLPSAVKSHARTQTATGSRVDCT